MSRGPGRGRVAVLVQLAALLVGFDCGPLPPPPPSANLQFSTEAFTTTSPSSFDIGVAVATNRSLQAYDVEVRYDPARLSLTGAQAYAEFDDDGSFFQSGVDASAGTVRLVDLLHGAPSSEGTVSLAILTFTTLAPGTVVLSVDGAVAMPDGALVPIALKKTAAITIR